MGPASLCELSCEQDHHVRVIDTLEPSIRDSETETENLYSYFYEWTGGQTDRLTRPIIVSQTLYESFDGPDLSTFTSSKTHVH